MIRTSLFVLFATTLMAQTPPAPAAAPKPAAPAREPGLYATINTSMGPIVAVLYEKESPITVRNFVALSRGTKPWTDPKTGQKVTRPLYSGVIFHRVIPGFMIQTGDPLGNGTGDGGLTPIPDEFHPTLKFDKPGRLGMANAGLKTGTCQFFITEVPTPHLDGKHTIFGQVIEGQELVTKIAHVPTTNEKPNTTIRILNIAIKREGPPPAPATTMKKAAPSGTKAGATGTPAAKKAAPPATKQ
jgi:peptidyl-prolyl cis-trans isomerase A (cyclophilin A)